MGWGSSFYIKGVLQVDPHFLGPLARDPIVLECKMRGHRRGMECKGGLCVRVRARARVCVQGLRLEGRDGALGFRGLRLKERVCDARLRAL